MCISKPERAVYKNKEQTGIYQVTALANNKIHMETVEISFCVKMTEVLPEWRWGTPSIMQHVEHIEQV